MNLDFKRELIDIRTEDSILTQKVVKGQWKQDANGDNITDGNGQWIPITETVPMTFRHAALEALMASLPEDHRISAEDKLKRGKLMEKICFSPDSSFSVEEVSLIKERIAKVYNPLVVIAVERLVENEKEENENA